MDQEGDEEDMLDFTEDGGEAKTRQIDETGEEEPSEHDYADEEDNRSIVEQIVDESNRTGEAESLVLSRRFDDLLQASKKQIQFLKRVGEDWGAVVQFKSLLQKLVAAARNVTPGVHNSAASVYATTRDVIMDEVRLDFIETIQQTL